MRYINLRFTYLLTYLLFKKQNLESAQPVQISEKSQYGGATWHDAV